VVVLHLRYEKWRDGELLKTKLWGAQRHTGWRIGKIAEGYAADMMFVDESYAGPLPTAELDGFSNRLHNLLIECRPHMPRDVMIGGEWVVRDGRITTVDEEVLDTSYTQIARRIS
jgi:cytosine/adenosine deaminase-related metal-dependent hydrolase